MILLATPLIIGFFLLILSSFAIFIIADLWVPLKISHAKVIGLELDRHRPDHFDLIVRFMSGFRKSDSEILIQVDGELSRAYISSDQYKKAKIEQDVEVRYRSGRFTKYPYIEKVSI